MNNPILNTLYYYVSVGCTLYIVYLELFDRLTVNKIATLKLDKDSDKNEPVVYANIAYDQKIEITGTEPKNKALIERLENYMRTNNAWRDPDLTLNNLASALFTNRTTLAQVLRENGYDNYTNYIKKLRIDDFVQLINSEQIDSFQEAFYFVGFRSRSTALRNFQQITGITPTEFFSEKN